MMSCSGDCRHEGLRTASGTAEPGEPGERGAVGTLSFPLPECRQEMADALNVVQWQLALWEVGQELRNRDKWGEYGEEASKLIGELRERFYEICEDLGVSGDG